MKITQMNNMLNLISVKRTGGVTKEEIKKINEKKLADVLALSLAKERALKAEGVEKDVMVANIEAASVNPELVNNLKFRIFHSEKDYDTTGRDVGKKIDIYDTNKC